MVIEYNESQKEDARSEMKTASNDPCQLAKPINTKKTKKTKKI